MAKSCCIDNPYAKNVVNFCKEKGLKTILATSPFFPKNSMVTRLEFIGLSEFDFDYITSYENCYFAKNNAEFYNHILNKNKLKPSEVIMFGNSENEDKIIPSSIGINSYLVNETHSNNDENSEKIDFNEIPKVIENLL